MSLEESAAALRRGFSLEELPEHPPWCVEADQPRRACAAGPSSGPFPMVSHHSVDPFNDGTFVYLTRIDFAGLQTGRIEIGLAHDGSLEIEEARALAFELLEAADRAEAAQSPALNQ